MNATVLTTGLQEAWVKLATALWKAPGDHCLENQLKLLHQQKGGLSPAIAVSNRGLHVWNAASKNNTFPARRERGDQERLWVRSAPAVSEDLPGWAGTRGPHSRWLWLGNQRQDANGWAHSQWHRQCGSAMALPPGEEWSHALLRRRRRPAGTAPEQGFPGMSRGKGQSYPSQATAPEQPFFTPALDPTSRGQPRSDPMPRHCQELTVRPLLGRKTPSREQKTNARRFPKNHLPSSLPQAPQPLGKGHEPCTACFITWEAPWKGDPFHIVAFQKLKIKETGMPLHSIFFLPLPNIQEPQTPGSNPGVLWNFLMVCSVLWP